MHTIHTFAHAAFWPVLLTGLTLIWAGTRKPRNRFLPAPDKACRRNSVEALP